MIITANEAEQKLLRHIRGNRARMPGSYCCHIALAGRGVTKTEIFDTVTTELKEYASFFRIQFFLCHDGDVFLMNPLWPHDYFAEAASIICDALQCNMDEAASIFDIAQDFAEIETLCRAKQLVLQQERMLLEQRSDYERDRLIQDAIIAGLEDDRLASLYARREQREGVLVMVADDDKICRTLATHIINPHYATRVSTDGETTIRDYVEHAPDVLFLDIGLPDMSGHTILETLFSIDEDAYIVMFSGRKDRDNILRAMECGARGFVGKPFTQGSMIDYITASPFVQEKRIREAG